MKTKYTITINYDAIPSEGFKYMAEINDENCEAVDYISTNDKSYLNLDKILENFIKELH